MGVGVLKAYFLNSFSFLLFFFFSILLFFAFSSSVFAYGSEKILNFESNIVVNKDASVDVTEIISVYANQERILHGIVRQLPTYYVDSYGVAHSTSYELKEVLVNNAPSDYHTAFPYHQFKVYVGSADKILAPGIYVYTIQYHVNEAINFLKDADELYWNVTGNEWEFPILKASADIHLPEGAKIINYAGYTGPVGAQGHNFYAQISAENAMTFTTLQPLMPGEGLTIAVAWPKGIEQAPTFVQKMRWSFHVNQTQYLLVEITALIFFYYLCMWSWHGRHWRNRTIIPIFEPPLHLSPAALRYIRHMRFDIKGFTAAIVDMAIKGALTIQNNHQHFSLIEKNRNAVIADEEKAALYSLFDDKTTLDLTPKNFASIRGARAAAKTSLKNAYKNVYFTDNSRYLIPGWLLTGVVFLLVAFSSGNALPTLLNLIMFTVLIIFAIFFGFKAMDSIKNAYEFISFSTVGPAISALFAFIAVLAMLISTSVLNLSMVPLAIFPLLFLLVIFNLIFYQLLLVPTAEGFKLIDQIDGFKLFLTTTERYRLNQLTIPQQAPELFETYLPYAIALDVEAEWGEQFSRMLQAAGTEAPAYSYQPAWYSSTTPFRAGTVMAFPVLLNSGLTNSISASSSASGGGGSVGGGSGGGGGGGW